jgi:predicted nucleic acid-binding protein
MNLVDSSGWLEYFGDGRNAEFFAPPIENLAQLLVPTVCIYEVFKKFLQERNEDEAISAVAFMQRGRIVHLDLETSLSAAKISKDLKLPMADSIILSTARTYQATIWTQDADFKNLPDVKYISKS